MAIVAGLPSTSLALTPTKFSRSYHLTITGKSGKEIVITYPITIDFNISHHLFAAANAAEINLYGLSEYNRSEISFNQIAKAGVYPIILRAGYLSQIGGGSPIGLPVIFTGYAHVAYTERQGTDLVTRINAFDMADLSKPNPQAYFGPGDDVHVFPGTPWKQQVRQAMGALYPIKPGEINVIDIQLPVNNKKAYTFTGRVWTVLMKLASEIGRGSGGMVYVENGVVNVLGQTSTLSQVNSLGTLQSDSGLLGIPRYTGMEIMCSSIFEPALKIGAQIRLKSKYSPTGAPSSSSYTLSADSVCKIVAYTHHGVISGAVSGSLVSDITLMQLNTPVGNNTGGAV